MPITIVGIGKVGRIQAGYSFRAIEVVVLGIGLEKVYSEGRYLKLSFVLMVLG